MTELTATYAIMQANATIGIFSPFSVKVGDITIAISWGYNVLKIRLFDEYEEIQHHVIKRC